MVFLPYLLEFYWKRRDFVENVVENVGKSGNVEIVVEMVLSQLVGFVFVEIGVENG